MKTKIQKKQSIDETQELLKLNNSVTFIDFTGISAEDIKSLRKSLREIGAKMMVVKKKLLRIALEKNKIEFDPEQFNSQVATIFSSQDISELFGLVHKFYKDKEKKGFNILGSYNLSDKNFLDADTVKKIGQLPSKDILIAQLVGMLSAPIKMFLYIISEKSKMVEK
ncbi:MAG: 50S ribosomal protein L10 [Patescibacteria group bacterium]|nr:50S ribosomal protein L10 [Patescibacteria group bacterium]